MIGPQVHPEAFDKFKNILDKITTIASNQGSGLWTL